MASPRQATQNLLAKMAERKRRRLTFKGRIKRLVVTFLQCFDRKVEHSVRHIWHCTLAKWIFVKRLKVPEVEAATMRFIRTHTSVPVPRPLFTIHYRGNQYLFMTRVAGHVVNFEEFDSLSISVQEHIISQLAGFVAELRALSPPHGNAISSILGGPVYDLRLKFDGRVGPFVDEEHMNLQARSGLSFREIVEVKGPTYDPDQMLMKSHAIKHPIVFTHGDMAERNLLFDAHYNLTGILDCESAGWFPSHWEYVKAVWSLDPKDSAWAQAIELWIPPYKFEALADGFGLVDGLPPVDSYYQSCTSAQS